MYIQYTGYPKKKLQYLNLNIFRSTQSTRMNKVFSETLSFDSIAARFVRVSENLGGIKEIYNFSDFFHYFSFSRKLIKHFMKVVGNSFVIMHPNMHLRSQLPITCLFQFQRVGRG